MGFGKGSKLAPAMLTSATSDGDGRRETIPPLCVLPPAGTGPAGHDRGLASGGLEPSPAESGIASVQDWRYPRGPPLSDGARPIGSTVANSKALVRRPVIMRVRRGSRVARPESIDI